MHDMTTPLLETKDLVLVRALVEAGGVTKASKALHLSQSAVSHHLSRLEDKLGMALFARVGRGLEVTPSGQRLVAGASKVLAQLAALEEAMKPRRPARIRVSVECYTGYEWLAPVLRRFGEHYPEVCLQVRADTARSPVDALDDGRLDVVVAHQAPSSRHRARFLADDAFVVVLPSSHPLASSSSIRPACLRDELVISHEINLDQLRRLAAELFDGDPPPRSMRLPVTEAILQLTAHRFGVGIMPGWAAHGARDRPDLVVRPLKHPKARRRWRALYCKGHPERALLEALIDELVGWFRGPVAARTGIV